MFQSVQEIDPRPIDVQVDFLKSRFHSSFTWCAAANLLDLVDEMLQKLSEEELNWVDNGGKTALHLAIAKGWNHYNDDRNRYELPQSEVIKELVKRADINKQDANGNTPLHIAVMRRDVECIKLLLSVGARVDILNHEQKKPEDMLEITFEDLFPFIKKYANVFTLHQEEWNDNKDKVLDLLKARMPDLYLYPRKPSSIYSENKDYEYGVLKCIWNFLMLILLVPLILKYICRIDLFFELNSATKHNIPVMHK